jgi:hypothetical protein
MGVSHVRTDRLYDLDKLFENRREFFVVAALQASGAMRFSELAFAVSQYARVKVPDSTITCILGRLSRAGMVEAFYDNDHDACRLTESGSKTGAMIEAITHALDECVNCSSTNPVKDDQS